MNINTLKNANEVLKLVSKDDGTSKEVKADLENAIDFFGNIITDVDKALKKPNVKEDMKKGKLLVYPFRITL